MCRFTFGEAGKRRLDAAIHFSRASLAPRRHRVLVAYDRLIHAVRSRSELLSRRGNVHGFDVNTALIAMACHHQGWLEPAESWTPPRAPAWIQLGSLAQHLFARFPMPRFMTSVWLAGQQGKITPQHGWYKVLGLGESIRTANIPMRITRAMAHRFMKAPSHLGAIGALRWAQVLSRGGTDELAKAILATRLGTSVENDDFWETVVQFFVIHPHLSPAQIGAIVSYLQHQKFAARDGISAAGHFARLRPPEPELVMRGRSPAALVRLAESWQRQFGRRGARLVTWPRAPIAELQWIDHDATRDERAWTIRELCTNEALFMEGRAMRHCVGIYVQRCLRHRTSIWSMQVETKHGPRHVLTIEVDTEKRRIGLVKRKCNEDPNDAERAIVARWAALEGLSLPESFVRR